MKLHLDPADLSTCVSCGLCLPHCPTFRVTGEEALSPRGRITAMRAVESGAIDVDDEVVHFMESCVQCRGCEPACPSGVPYGRLIEGTRRALAESGRSTPRWQRLGYRVLGHHRILLAGSTVLAVAQRARLVPRRLGLPRLALRRPRQLRASGDDVWMFTGCVMDAWMRPTHVATKRVVEAVGAGVALAGPGGACCGALHVHAGLHDQAVALAERVMGSMPGDAPVLVNSAGCGAALREYGILLGTPDAHRFAARVVDVHEWLAGRLDRLPPAARRLPPVIVQDPCHLRHVQKAHLPVRQVLAHVADVVEIDDDGLCCGAGGAYSALEPDLASAIRDRKAEHLRRAMDASGASVVASANPGCAMHLTAAGFDVRHPMDLVVDAW